MNDLDSRLRSADRLEVADLWPDIQGREPRPPSKQEQRRLPTLAAALVIGVAAVALMVAAFWGAKGTAPATSVTPSGSTGVAFHGLHLDEGNGGGEWFDPPPPGAAPLLSAEEAFARFHDVDREWVLPADATAELGLYSRPLGDGVFRFHDELAYGYSYPRVCTPDPGIPGASEAPPSPAPSCTWWLFLDADTGSMLVALQVPG